ncbi:MAG: nucleotidyltransferase family protein [Ruminococcus sp.]|nr:nucleotidyltransferase family protein [Ruminococcus sp.]
MLTAGIVAEFNPFHEGHKYLIQQARERGATHIVCCMSGAAVQRGELAITDKHTRAAMAIDGGADLVVELPAPFSCSSAEFFAKYAVRSLTELGIDTLAFGSEYDDKALLYKAAEAALSLPDTDEVRAFLEQGMTYPAAVAAAARKLAGDDVADLLSSPNSTLAVTYINALASAPQVDIMPVKRIGAAHDSDSADDLPSGMELRRRMLSGELKADFAPIDPTAAEAVIYYSILTADKPRIMQLPELGAPLADRMIKLSAAPPPALEDFLISVKNKSCTLARLRRSALHLAIGVEGAADLIPEPPHIRILAMNSRGREVLSAADPHIPVSASLKKLEESSPRAARIIGLENRAVKLQQICTGCFVNEYTRKFQPQK